MSRKAPWVRIPPSPPADTATAVSFDSNLLRCFFGTQTLTVIRGKGMLTRSVRMGPTRRRPSNPVRSERKQRYEGISGCRRGADLDARLFGWPAVELGKRKGHPAVSLSQVVRVPDVDRPTLLRPLNQPSVRGRVVAHCHKRGSLCPKLGTI